MSYQKISLHITKYRQSNDDGYERKQNQKNGVEALLESLRQKKADDEVGERPAGESATSDEETHP